jgi:hypothetical protein
MPAGKRVAEDDEWELRKEKIVKLYQDEDEPLPKVIHLMTKGGFKRTYVICKITIYRLLTYRQ